MSVLVFFLAFRCRSQIMCVKLPSVSERGGIVLTDGLTFIATQALQCIMQIKQKEELKEVKSLRRQKHTDR